MSDILICLVAGLFFVAVAGAICWVTWKTICRLVSVVESMIRMEMKAISDERSRSLKTGIEIRDDIARIINSSTNSDHIAEQIATYVIRERNKP